MRRKDRELKDMAVIMEIVERETVCTVAFHDEPCPYLIPMNYGAAMEEGKLILYFHGAAEGTKLSRIRENPRVSFCMYGENVLRLDGENACASTTSFESVCGFGLAEIVAPEERKKGLAVLMNHLGRKEGKTYSEASFPDAAVAPTVVWKITVDTITGKRHE